MLIDLFIGLNRKRYEIHQTISCFGAFKKNLCLNNITKFASKSLKLTTFIEIIMESTCVSSFYQDYRRKFIRAPRVPWLFFKYGFLKCTIQISFFENLFKIWKLRKNFKAQFSWRLHNVRLFVKLPKFFVSADPSTVHPLLLEYNESHSKTSFKRQPAS